MSDSNKKHIGRVTRPLPSQPPMPPPKKSPSAAGSLSSDNLFLHEDKDDSDPQPTPPVDDHDEDIPSPKISLPMKKQVLERTSVGTNNTLVASSRTLLPRKVSADTPTVAGVLPHKASVVAQAPPTITPVPIQEQDDPNSHSMTAEDKLHQTIKLAKEKEDISFGSKLTFAIESVKTQVIQGKETLKDLQNFVDHMSAVEEQMGASLAKNAKQEIQNVVSVKEHDKMNTTWMAWMALLNQTERISEVHLNFAKSAKDIIRTLQVAIDVSTERYQQILEQEQRVEDLLKMVRVNLEKSRSKAKKALNEVGDFDSIIEDLTERAKKGEGGRKATGVFGGLGKNRDKAVAKASEVAEGYQAQVDAANEFLHTYATREIPGILMELQTLEEMRMTNMKFQFHQYIGLFDNMAHGILVRLGLDFQLSNDCFRISLHR
jgi:hypothetical protein